MSYNYEAVQVSQTQYVENLTFLEIQVWVNQTQLVRKYLSPVNINSSAVYPDHGVNHQLLAVQIFSQVVRAFSS